MTYKYGQYRGAEIGNVLSENLEKSGNFEEENGVVIINIINHWFNL